MSGKTAALVTAILDKMDSGELDAVKLMVIGLDRMPEPWRTELRRRGVLEAPEHLRGQFTDVDNFYACVDFDEVTFPLVHPKLDAAREYRVSQFRLKHGIS